MKHVSNNLDSTPFLPRLAPGLRQLVSPVLTLVLAAGSAFGAEIRYVNEKDSLKTSFALSHIEITGEIAKGDVEKLRKALAQAKAYPDRFVNVIVILNSPGGNVPVALEMGRILRESVASTFVANGGTCGSSCIFLLAGGVIRTMGVDSRVGLHRPRFEYELFGSLSQDEARTAYDKLVTACTDFMKAMGISEQVFADMLRVPSQQVRFVGPEYTGKYGLEGVDPAWAEWSRARDVIETGEDRVKAEDQLYECYRSGGDKNECRERYRKELRKIIDKRNSGE